MNSNTSDLTHTKLFNIYLMLLMNLWPKMALLFPPSPQSLFTILLNRTEYFSVSPSISFNFPLLNNPDLDSYQDIHSNSPHFETDSPFVSFDPHISLKTIPHSNFNSSPSECKPHFESFNPHTSCISIVHSKSHLLLPPYQNRSLPLP